MIFVEVKSSSHEDVEYALKAFKRQVLRSGILKEIRRRAGYLKPGDKLRLKRKLSRGRKKIRYTDD